MQPFDRISIISQNERSTVSLVCMRDSDTMAILKERQGASYALLQKISELKSPYFPEIYELERGADSVSILEEQLCGKTLREMLDFGLSFSEEDFISITESIAAALLTLHSLTPPIILRDLKPENIMITDDKRIMIVDLDAAREYDSEATGKDHDTILLGTRSYAAPEQYGFTQTDIRADIYSFGIVIKELLDTAHCNDAFVKKAQKILHKATMFAPEERYQNVNQMLGDIRRLRSTKPRPVLRTVLSAACGFVLGIVTALAIVTVWDNRTSAKPSEDGTLIPSPAAETAILSPSAEPSPTPVLSQAASQSEAADYSPVWAPTADEDEASQDYSDSEYIYYKGIVIHKNEAGEYCYWFFENDYKPQSITFPYSVGNIKVQVIDRYSFNGNSSLIEVTVSDGITAIREAAFQDCYNLKKITIPDSVTEFGDNVLGGDLQVTIYCHKGSAAEQYAIDNHFSYSIME